MKRDEVERNQRSRMYGAMIEAVSVRGYECTTVADVITLAGVSRRAFYELFENKEACFLGAYDIVIASTRRRVLEAWVSQRGWEHRLHAACKVLLDDIAAEPKGPHLVVVDALGIGPQARERMHLAGFTFERLIHTALELSPGEVGFPIATPRAVVGGIRHIVFARMLEGREKELYTAADEVLDWIECYRTPLASRLGAVRPVRPSHEPPVAAAFLTRDDRRARLMGSVVHLTLDSGYEELTDPQIAQFAGYSTEAFHKHFRDKEQCFLAVLDEFVAEAIDSVRPSIEGASTWAEGVCLGMAAFMRYLVAHQALLRIAFIDLFEVGPGMVGRMTRSVEDLTKLMTENGPEPVSGPGVALEAVTGAVWGIIATYVAKDRLSRLPSLVDHLAFIVLAPYVGAKDAIEAIEAARPPEDPAEEY
jgi:AcrR family transcriptional regulator